MNRVRLMMRETTVRIAAAMAVIACLIAGMPALRASPDWPDVDASETSLLYLEGSDWSHQSDWRKIELATDFMRVFCADRTMSVGQLVGCLDRRLVRGPAFEQAIACVSEPAAT